MATVTCDKCNGSGSVRYDCNPTEPCPEFCFNRSPAYYELDGQTPCSACGGDGRVTCHHCSGNGYIDSECPKCEGAGTVESAFG